MANSLKVFNVIFNLYGDDAIIDQVVANTVEQATEIAVKMYGSFGFVAVREYNGETGVMDMEGARVI